MPILSRPKKLVFCNNKGWVWKTTLAFNCAFEFASRGYKTVLVDLDPQCNLTLQCLWGDYFEPNLFSGATPDIWTVLAKRLEWSGDVDFSVGSVQLQQDNLFLIPGSLSLSRYEAMLADSSFNEAASGNKRGFLDTSAIDRFLNFRWLEDGVDIFVIDTSPSLGALNRALLLGTDFFVVPMMADAFSVQGVENLGVQLERWKRNWLITARALARDPQSGIDNSEVLQGECLFLGYIVNNFNVYSGKTIQRQDEWRQKIPSKVKEFLSEKHCKNGLVANSWPNPIWDVQDYGQLTAISMELCKAVQALTPEDDPKLNLKWTRELSEKAHAEFQELWDQLLTLVLKYQ